MEIFTSRHMYVQEEPRNQLLCLMCLLAYIRTLRAQTSLIFCRPAMRYLILSHEVSTVAFLQHALLWLLDNRVAALLKNEHWMSIAEQVARCGEETSSESMERIVFALGSSCATARVLASNV